MTQVKTTLELKKKVEEIAEKRNQRTTVIVNEALSYYVEGQQDSVNRLYIIGALQTIEHAFECGTNIKPLISKLAKWIKK